MRKAGRAPKARRRGLILEKLDDELLVYDLDSHKAHCLNRAAALVWSHCDGGKSAVEIARLLAYHSGIIFTEEVVELALEQLERFKLLEEGARLPNRSSLMSRRELGRKLGLASLAALPCILSIPAPVAAQAASCATAGNPCRVNANCCSGLCINNICACLDFGSPCTSDAQCCSTRCGSANNKCLP